MSSAHGEGKWEKINANKNAHATYISIWRETEGFLSREIIRSSYLTRNTMFNILREKYCL